MLNEELGVLAQKPEAGCSKPERLINKKYEKFLWIEWKWQLSFFYLKRTVMDSISYLKPVI